MLNFNVAVPVVFKFESNEIFKQLLSGATYLDWFYRKQMVQ